MTDPAGRHPRPAVVHLAGVPCRSRRPRAATTTDPLAVSCGYCRRKAAYRAALRSMTIPVNEDRHP